MIITILSPYHAQACADLHEKCFEVGWQEKDFLNYLENPAILALGIFHDNILVSMIFLSLVIDEAEILTICTSPHYQKQGFASALLQKALQECSDRLITQCFLEVAVTNQSAINCYLNAGFSIVGIRKNYYKIANTSINANIMFKYL